jgi:hypothetical protein
LCDGDEVLLLLSSQTSVRLMDEPLFSKELHKAEQRRSGSVTREELDAVSFLVARRRCRPQHVTYALPPRSMFRNSGLPWELFQVKALMVIHCNQGNPSQIIPFLPVDDSQGKLLIDIEDFQESSLGCPCTTLLSRYATLSQNRTSQRNLAKAKRPPHCDNNCI